METTSSEKQLQSESLTVPLFGYELIREVLLTELLGKDTPEILYWAGKRLARKYPLKTVEAVIDFFEKAGWGHLSLRHLNPHEMELELSGELIKERFKRKRNCSFQLEAGFLAEQVQLQKGFIAEAYEHPKKLVAKVRFTIKWDSKATP
ncbi:YslB family protein [Bacillus aquiflavi]|uniref:YslB family protein n=1 Tax=Bacillus aquiflavi TaxID=2672567 RepID=A0A6B3W3X8_9BACI|nr:YslB family protein [Bacillus aquiflavi]NEY82626.1 YslB family protein [Bacillus aquiflavi]UAC50081.1 YslB family protein [Bacillus aquiflavi]